MKIITFANQKGGVGKSTTAFAFTTFLKQRGYKVLSIDLDPQANFSKAMNSNKETPYLVEAFRGNIPFNATIEHLHYGDFVASNEYLSMADTESIGDINRFTILDDMIKSIDNQLYDYVLIDTPPSLGYFTLSAFIASDEIIVPCTSTSFSIDGLISLEKTLKSVQNRLNPNIKFNGIVFSKFKSNTSIGNDLIKTTNEIAKMFNIYVYKQTIRETVKVEEAYVNKESFFDYDKTANFVNDFENLVDEFLEREEKENGEK